MHDYSSRVAVICKSRDSHSVVEVCAVMDHAEFRGWSFY
jgi:hypothetical protein